MEYHLFVKKYPKGVSAGLYGYLEEEKSVWKKLQNADENTGFSNEIIDSVNPIKNFQKVKGLFTKSTDAKDESTNNPGFFDGISKAFQNQKFQKLEDFNSEHDGILITRKSLKGIFDINDKELVFGKLTPKVLRSIFQQQPDSTITIRPIDKIPEFLKHFSGSDGKFNEGLWVSHPKHKNTLLPLRNLTEKVKQLILEETIRAYEALGAKRILIEDITSLSQSSKSRIQAVSTSNNYSRDQFTQREKEYGPGVFDPERAKKDKLFIWDIPAVKTTIDARIYGNQTLEKFTEKIKLNIGIEVETLKALNSVSANMTVEQEWRFLVEFYPKEQITQV